MTYQETATLVMAGSDTLDAVGLKRLHREIAQLIECHNFNTDELCSLAKACNAIDDLYNLRATNEILHSHRNYRSMIKANS